VGQCFWIGNLECKFQKLLQTDGRRIHNLRIALKCAIIAFQLFEGLLDRHRVLYYTDTLLQKVDDQRCIVKNAQVRDTNFWYDVPPVLESGLVVPPGLVDKPHRRSASAGRKSRNSASGGENDDDDEDFELPDFRL